VARKRGQTGRFDKRTDAGLARRLSSSSDLCVLFLHEAIDAFRLPDLERLLVLRVDGAAKRIHRVVVLFLEFFPVCLDFWIESHVYLHCSTVVKNIPA